jgi:hypothetical protein
MKLSFLCQVQTEFAVLMLYSNTKKNLSKRTPLAFFSESTDATHGSGSEHPQLQLPTSGAGQQLNVSELRPPGQLIGLTGCGCIVQPAQKLNHPNQGCAVQDSETSWNKEDGSAP